MSEIKLITDDLIQLEPKEFYLKHILKSHNWYFSNYLHISNDVIIDSIDSFKEIVSENFDISFHSVQLVGSAKLGYSLSPNKLFKPFNPESSDIDIAVISDKLYLYFWDRFRKLKGRYAVYNTKFYEKIAKSIYRGFINEDDITQFSELNTEWKKKSNPVNILLQDKMNFEQEITYRIYRSWEDLEDYQLYSITNARKRSLEGV